MKKYNENLEFISLRDFLDLEFLNLYSYVKVFECENEDLIIDCISIKDLKIELDDNMYEEYQDNYYVSDLMPDFIITIDDPILKHKPIYTIYLKRF